MAGLQWNVGHLQGRISGLDSNFKHLKALLDMCYMQSRYLFGEEDDEIDEDRTTLIGLFRLGNFLLEDLEANINKVREIANAGVREQQTAPKGGE